MTVTIRFAEPDDAAGVLAIYAPFCQSSPVSFEVVAPTFDRMAERIVQISEQYPWLVCEIDGCLAGYVYASQHRERAAYRWAVEVGAYIHREYYRRGVGRALYTTLFTILRQQGYYKAFAGITLPNEASVGLHETLGFTPVGVYRGVGYKCGQWLDVGWWQLDLQPERADPPIPEPITTVRDSETTADALARGARLVR